LDKIIPENCDKAARKNVTAMRKWAVVSMQRSGQHTAQAPQQQLLQQLLAAHVHVGFWRAFQFFEMKKMKSAHQNFQKLKFRFYPNFR
jgi:hypothetical protein